MVDKALKGEASPLEACVAARNASAFEWLAFCQSFRVDHACIIPYFSHFSPRTTAGFTAFMEKQSVDWEISYREPTAFKCSQVGGLVYFYEYYVEGTFDDKSVWRNREKAEPQAMAKSCHSDY